MKRVGGLALLLTLAGLLLAVGPADLEPAPEYVDATELIARAADSLRGERSVVEAVMSVLSSRESEQRVVRYRSYHDRNRRRVFLRVLAPERDADTSFLMLDPNLWVYVPSADRTVLVPSARLADSWLGGDFTHEDLMRAWCGFDEYDHRVLGIDPSAATTPGSHFYVVESTPALGRDVSWPRILTWIEAERGVPLRREFYAGDGTRDRVLTFSDVRKVGGRSVPHLRTLTSAGGGGRETRIEIQTIDFDGGFDDAVFTTRHLAAKE